MQTTSFVLPQIKDIVFDRKNKVEGRVTYIDFKSKKAKIEVIVNNDKELQQRTTALVESKLYDLIVLEKYPRKEFDKNRQHTLVKEFQKLFGHPVAEKPTLIPAERGLNRTVWTGEELVEFLHALSNDRQQFTELYEGFLDGLHIAYLKSLKKDFIIEESDKIVALADALTDTSYFVNGSFVELGVLPQPLFEIVHASNMSKLFTALDGTKYAKSDDDGKSLKSPEFFPPEQKLKEEVLRQAKQA